MNDKKNIKSFLKKNKNKEIIVVQGLGFVGAVMSLVCANSETEYAVIGVDLPDKKNLEKINQLNNGVFPIVASDPKIDIFFKNAIKRGNFYATYDEYAYSLANYIIIDINLDVEKINSASGSLENYNVNITPFKNAIKTISNNCKEDVLILVETTVPPGTCKSLVKPIIESGLKKRKLNLNNYKVGHSYERVMPGPNYIDSIKNFYRVYSGIDNKSADYTEKFLKTIISVKKFPLTRLKNTNSSEYAKVLENSYRAYNIAFATEWSRFAEESEVNMYEVVDAIRMRPTHSNLMYPGIGVGGYCLTKDPLLASWSKINNFKSKSRLSMSENGVKINDQMPLFAFNYMKKKFDLKSLTKSKVLLLGISYRSEIGDTRFSPVEKFYNFLKLEISKIILHDPYVKFWDELGLKINNSIEKVIYHDPEIIIFSTAHSIYSTSNSLNDWLMSSKNKYIYDVVGILSEDQLNKYKSLHNVIVLGRGDI